MNFISLIEKWKHEIHGYKTFYFIDLFENENILIWFEKWKHNWLGQESFEIR